MMLVSNECVHHDSMISKIVCCVQITAQQPLVHYCYSYYSTSASISCLNCDSSLGNEFVTISVSYNKFKYQYYQYLCIYESSIN